MKGLKENLFEDRVASLKNAFYGLVFAELTYNTNFNENIDFTSNFLTIMQNIVFELESNEVDYDLTDLDSMGRTFAIDRLVKNTDDTFNVLKTFPFIYLTIFKHDFDFSNENIEFETPKDFPYRYHSDKVVFRLANSINSHVSQEEIYCNVISASILWIFFSKYYGYKVIESENISELIEWDFNRTKRSCDRESINIKNPFDFLFENFSKMTIDDINATKGFVNTIFSVIYSLNSDSFYESIHKAIKLENELGLTTAITAIIAACYYKIDEDFDAMIPILYGNPKEKISFKEYINGIADLNPFLDNFENCIVKEQLRQIIRFIPFFQSAKESDCYTSESIYPMYPEEMINFNHIVDYSLIDDRYVHRHYEEIMNKYNDKQFGKDYAKRRKHIVDKANFHELKVCLNEYLRAEHMCEGWWGGAIDEKIFYAILLKFKDIYDSINVKQLNVPVMDYKNTSKEIFLKSNKDNVLNENKYTQRESDNINIAESKHGQREQYTENIGRNKYAPMDFDSINITIVLNKKCNINVGNILTLVKEPDNNYDDEAIEVKLGDEKIAYVANSTNTVIKGTMSAGRVYDKINDTQEAEIILMDKNSIIAKIIF